MDHGRQHRNEHDRDDHQLEMSLEERPAAEKVAPSKTSSNPQDRADDAKGEEADVIHAAHTGNERREGANDRHEAGEDHRLGPVLLIKGLRMKKMLLVE